MFGILGEHAANQIADDRWQMPVAQKGSIRPHFELAANNGRVVHLRHRRLAKAKTEQQHAKRIDIVGNAAVTPARSHAHGGIGWLEQRGLAHDRRRGPRRPQHNGLTRSLLEHVVEANTAMGHAARLHLLQDQRRWPEHAFEQFGFRPGVRPDHQAWPGWGEADDVIGLFPGTPRRGCNAMDQRCEKSVDRNRECLQRPRSWRQVSLDPYCHQIGPTGVLIGRRKGGKPTYRRQRPTHLHDVAAGDQGEIRSGLRCIGHAAADRPPERLTISDFRSRVVSLRTDPSP
jgi:hypothetical protein